MSSDKKTNQVEQKNNDQEEESLSNNNIYFPQFLNIILHVKSNELNRDINSTLHKILKNKVEGMCVKEGMIIRDSTKIISKKGKKKLMEKAFNIDKEDFNTVSKLLANNINETINIQSKNIDNDSNRIMNWITQLD